MENFNIFVYRRSSNTTIVQVRNSYSLLFDDDARYVFPAEEMYDSTAIARTGHVGAFVYRHRADMIEAAVAGLRAEFGADIPVQVNIPAADINRPLSIDGIVADRGCWR